ncbi:hypothetical protein BGX27_009866 [Mortierella sp. AM989]|nr:hypothetical protein BGX27_009866 [Mortierella sp. AM989]
MQHARAMLNMYLSHNSVHTKNTTCEKFTASLNVFVDGVQNPVQADPSDSQEPHISHRGLQERFTVLRDQNALNRYKRLELQKAKKSESPMQHKSYNQYRTVDRPAPQNTDTGSQVKTSHRSRYAIKRRSRQKEYDVPEAMKQYTLKPYKNVPENPMVQPSNVPKSGKKAIANQSKPPKPIGMMKRKELVSAMQWEHPMVTLDVGTVSTNVKGVLGSDPNLALEVRKCIQDAVRLAADAKRSCQILLGRFIEHISSSEFIKESDREFLDNLCERLPTETKDGSYELDDDDETSKQDHLEDISGNQHAFIFMVMRCLYARKFPDKNERSKVALNVENFIKRLQELNLLDNTINRGKIVKEMPYPASSLLRSVSTQLMVELRKIYRNGTLELVEKLKRQSERDQLGSKCDITIHNGISAIENFVRLNSLTKNRRKLAPLTPIQQPFVSFTEGELLRILWKNDTLKKKIKDWNEEAKNAKTPYSPSQDDMINWLMDREPGYLVTQLLSPVGKPIQKRQGPRGYKDKTIVMSLKQMRKHIKCIQSETFDRRSHWKRGYSITGSIRTDGFRLQLLAFKLKELNSVRYKRLPQKDLPSQITSTIGGVDYWLTEVRNIIKTAQDVQTLWGCKPAKIKILGIDLGQAYVVGASALLPEPDQTKEPGDTKTRMPSKTDSSLPSRDDNNPPSEPVVFHNLAVKQKAVYQPTFKLRRWLEDRKKTIPPNAPEGYVSISDIESSLPPLRGEFASFNRHTTELEGLRDRLDDFYNSKNLVARHQWDAKRARDHEYRLIANRLLKMIGGSIGRKRGKRNKAVIGVGLE